MKYFTVREISFIALLAAVNSVAEISIGSLMHALHLPGKGIVLVSINLIIYFLVSMTIKKRGTVLTVGFITSFIKLVYGWEAVKIGPSAAILTEAAIVEGILYISAIKPWTAVLCGSAAKIFTLFFPFISYMVLGMDRGGANVQRIIEGIDSMFPALPLAYLILLGVLWNAVIGGVLGYAAFHAAKGGFKIYTLMQKTVKS